MDEIIKALKMNQSQIRQIDYAKIINALTKLGYSGRPERWHDDKKLIKIVLPEKVEWFRDNPGHANEQQIIDALKEGGVDV